MLQWVSLQLPHGGRLMPLTPAGCAGLIFLLGAALFAVGMEMLRLTTAVYLTGELEGVDDLYGAIGQAAVFMTYLYLVARLTVAGFKINAAIWRFRHAEDEIQV